MNTSTRRPCALGLVLAVTAIVALASCGNGTTKPLPSEPTPGTAAPETKVSDPSPRIRAMKSAQFTVPDGYELGKSSDEKSVLLLGETGMMNITDSASTTSLEPLGECLSYAKGYGTGYLEALLEKPRGSMRTVQIEGGPFGDGGCRVLIAPEGEDPVMDVAVQRFGDNLVVVACTIGDEDHASACSEVQRSVKAR